MGAAPFVTRASVVIPVKDRAELLDRCLAALVPQLGDAAEIVVVDDGSRDGSAAVARRWAEQGPVRVLDGHGRGAVAARRMGVAETDTEILAFTDSDCVPSPGWIDAGLAAVDAGADLVQGRTTPTRRCGVLERSLWVISENGLYDSCNLFVRRSTYDAVGGFDPSAGDRLHYRAGRLRGLGFGEDTLLGWRIRNSGASCAFVPEAHVGHHVFPFDPAEHLHRAWQAGGFAGLVREVPELRRELLVDRVFLGSRRRLPLYLGAAALLGGRRRLAAVSAGAWVGVHGRAVLRAESSPRRRVAGLAGSCVADAVTAAALVTGSIRTRSIVL